MWGTLQKKLANLKISLMDNHSIHLILSGIGYRVEKINDKLRLKLGFSHNIEVTLPDNINAEITGNDQELILTSKDKEKLSLFATQIRMLRPPEPYKGKGIMVKEKQHLIIRKEGKRRNT
jgi:large subunit ribosomal protein L6